MSFIFSRALVAEYFQADCLAVDAYAPSNLIPTPKRSSLLGKTTEPFLRSRFGMTFEPLTDDVGEELLTSWLEGFPVKTSAQPEPATDSTANEAGYGSKWRASFARFDRSESKWKTAQCSLLGDSEEFSETWPRWGLMRNGGIVSAADTGAPHLRERIWIVAYADGEPCEQGRPDHAEKRARGRNANRSGFVAHVPDSGRGRHGVSQEQIRSGRHGTINVGRWPVEPGMGRVVDGMAHRAHRIRALGNGQVPRVAATAFTLLSNG